MVVHHASPCLLILVEPSIDSRWIGERINVQEHAGGEIYHYRVAWIEPVGPEFHAYCTRLFYQARRKKPPTPVVDGPTEIFIAYLTTGASPGFVHQRTVAWCPEDPERVEIAPCVFARGEGVEWHRTEEGAKARAAQMIEDRLTVLRKRVECLEELRRKGICVKEEIALDIRIKEALVDRPTRVK